MCVCVCVCVCKEYLDVVGRIMSEWKIGWERWTGFIWLRTRTRGELLRIR